MPKQKKHPSLNQTPSKQDNPLDKYDGLTLVNVLSSFDHSVGWEVFKAYLLHQAAFHMKACVYLSQETGHQIEASSAAAKAEVLNQAAEDFMRQLKEKVLGNDGVVSDPMPFEDEVPRS